MTPELDRLYDQHLTETDRRVIRSVGPATSVTAGRDLASVLAAPALEGLLFPAGSSGTDGAEVSERLAGTSPFLTFAVAVHRTAARLATATYVEERWAPRRRVPVFDVGPLRDLLADPGRCLFLIELLASYTHVSSGVTWQRTARGWRRRRFSEMDPVRLAELLEAVPAPERPGIYRRMGDLALFLTGVFPDHLGLGPVALDRLLRLSGLPPSGEDGPAPPDILESLGRRWYGLAASAVRAAALPVTAQLSLVEEMGRRFGPARRVLNVVTDWYLFPLREHWFGRS